MADHDFSERRKNKRYRVQKGVLVAPSTHVRKLWQVLDIGKGGLAFRYVSNDGELKTSSELDIVTGDTRFLLEQIPFRSISDFEMSDKPVSSRKVRRRGVQFGALTDTQVRQLDLLIRSHTASEA
jgi:hypothetical protein